MNALYTVNIVVALLAQLWPLWFSKRFLKLPLFNPLTVVLMLDLPVQVMKLVGGPLVLIDEGLFDVGYQMALLMGTVLTLSQVTGLVFFFKWFSVSGIHKRLPLANKLLSPKDLARACRVFLLLYAVSLYLLASSDFGVLNWLANPREGYQLHRFGLGHWYALAISSLSVALLLSFLSRPTIRAVLWRFPFFIGLAYLFGAKAILLSVFASHVIFLWFLRWRHLATIVVFGVPVIFSLMLWNLYLAVSDTFDLQTILKYFDFYKNAADYYRGVLSGEIQLFHGQIAIGSLWSYVPRALVPDKPFVYGVLNINEIFYPGQAEMTNTPAFGGAVEQYADFGVIGVLLGGFFSAQSISLALLSYLIFRRPGLMLNRVNVPMAMAMVMQFAPAFGTFFPGALYLVVVAIVVLIVVLVRRPRRRRQDHGTAPPAMQAR